MMESNPSARFHDPISPLFLGIKMRQAFFSLRFSVLPSLLLQSQSAASPPIARPNRCIASCGLTLEEKETPSPRSVHHHNGPFSHPSGYCLARLLQVRLPLQRWGEDCYCTVSMGLLQTKPSILVCPVPHAWLSECGQRLMITKPAHLATIRHTNLCCRS